MDVVTNKEKVADGSSGEYLRWYPIRKEGEVEVINIFLGCVVRKNEW
jgi:hypothetical protein